MAESLEKILGRHLPPVFTVEAGRDKITLRDSQHHRGEGFSVEITDSPRFLNASLRFDDFAMPLVQYAEKQLTGNPGGIRAVVEKHPALRICRQRLISEDLYVETPAREVAWWLEMEYRKTGDEGLDGEIFADLLLYLIFFLFPYRIGAEEEGADFRELSTRYERSRTNRSLCLAFHGHSCAACGTNMKKKYGALSEEFIHVHHIEPVSGSGARKFDPIRDLIPLCPNCHGVAHLKNPPYTVAEIQTMLNNE